MFSFNRREIDRLQKRLLNFQLLSFSYWWWCQGVWQEQCGLQWGRRPRKAMFEVSLLMAPFTIYLKLWISFSFWWPFSNSLMFFHSLFTSHFLCILFSFPFLFFFFLKIIFVSLFCFFASFFNWHSALVLFFGFVFLLVFFLIV